MLVAHGDSPVQLNYEWSSSVVMVSLLQNQYMRHTKRAWGENRDNADMLSCVSGLAFLACDIENQIGVSCPAAEPKCTLIFSNAVSSPLSGQFLMHVHVCVCRVMMQR